MSLSLCPSPSPSLSLPLLLSGFVFISAFFSKLLINFHILCWSSPGRDCFESKWCCSALAIYLGKTALKSVGYFCLICQHCFWLISIISLAHTLYTHVRELLFHFFLFQLFTLSNLNMLSFHSDSIALKLLILSEFWFVCSISYRLITMNSCFCCLFGCSEWVFHFKENFKYFFKIQFILVEI